MENGKKKYLDGAGAQYLVQQMQKGVDAVRENVDFNNNILYGRPDVPKVYFIDDLVDEPFAAGIDVNSDKAEEDYFTALVAALMSLNSSDKVAVGDIVETNMVMSFISAGIVTWASIFDCAPEDIPEGFPDNLPADASEELVLMAVDAKDLLSSMVCRFRRAGSGDNWTHGALPNLFGWQILTESTEWELPGLIGTVYDTSSRLSGITSGMQGMVDRVPIKELSAVGNYTLDERHPSSGGPVYSTTLECFLYQNGSGSGFPFADANFGEVGKLQEYTVTRPKLGHIYVLQGRSYGQANNDYAQIFVGQYNSEKRYNVLVAYNELPTEVSAKVEDLISTMDLVNAAFEGLSGRVAALEAKAESVTD